jgi:tRNA(Ile)-lysidine synthase
MKYILAVSGGVDSAVLLDKMANQSAELIVAHFDHGIRPNSNLDAEFVRDLAKKYELKFFIGQGQLGSNASEELARRRRYEFLDHVRIQTAADQIVTAHHADDLIETAIINLIRGTGWRGLAPMSSQIYRPLIKLSKAEIVRYAIDHNLSWVEDETNFEARYFRNRVRDLVSSLAPGQRQALLELIEAQTTRRLEIEKLIEQLYQVSMSGEKPIKLKRYDLIMWSPDIAKEILRRATGDRLTWPQISQIWLFARTAPPQKMLKFGNKITIIAKKRYIYIDIC